MRYFFLFIVILLSITVRSQDMDSGSLDYNPYSSTVSITCSNIRYLPDSILDLQFKILRVENCCNLNYSVLFKQLSKKVELHTIYLRNCNLIRIPNVIDKIPNLKVLIIDNNHLRNISRYISRLKLETLSISSNNIGALSWNKQSKLFKSIAKLTSSSGLILFLDSNNLDSVPPCFEKLNLKSIDISDNNFVFFPKVFISMVNNGNLRKIEIDNLKSLIHEPDVLNGIQNRNNRKYVNISFVCFKDDFCINEEDIDKLNILFPAIRFTSTWRPLVK